MYKSDCIITLKIRLFYDCICINFYRFFCCLFVVGLLFYLVLFDCLVDLLRHGLMQSGEDSSLHYVADAIPEFLILPSAGRL